MNRNPSFIVEVKSYVPTDEKSKKSTKWYIRNENLTPKMTKRVFKKHMHRLLVSKHDVVLTLINEKGGIAHILKTKEGISILPFSDDKKK